MKYFKKIINRIKCYTNNHEWVFMWGNYQTSKDVFKCVNCGKEIEE